MRETREYRVELVRHGERVAVRVRAASVGEAVEFARGPLAGPTTVLTVVPVTEAVTEAVVLETVPAGGYAVEVGGTVVATVRRVELAA